MRDILYQYLVLHKRLTLPGIGTLNLKREAAVSDIANKELTAPAYSFELDNEAEPASEKLFKWLSPQLDIPEWEAIRKLNDFAFDLKNQALTKEGAEWDKVGILKKSVTGSIILEPAELSLESELPVAAEKVVREHEEHILLVGEKETTSHQMEELLLEKEKQRDWGWVIAVVITVIALMLSGLYFSENGLTPSAAANKAAFHAK